MANAATGALAKLYVETGTGARTYNAPTAEAYEFVSEGLQATQPVLDTRGIRGTRSMPFERTRQGIRSITGDIVFHPSPKDLDKWLPRIMGTSEVTNVFALGDTFSAFGVFIDRVTQQFSYTDCLVSRAAFRCQPGAIMEMSLTVIGGDETVNPTDPTNAPSLTVTAADAPYVFHDAQGAVALPSIASAEIFDMEIVIDNVMNARFVNAVTTTSIVAMDRVVTLGITVPYDTAHDQVYRLASGSRGLPGSITFTNGSYSTKFEFASLDGPDISPVVQGKQEIVLRLDYVARSSGTSQELVVTNVSS